MDPLSFLRWASIVGWLYLGLRIAVPAARAFSKRPRADDPWFATIMGFGFVFLIFASRYLFVPTALPVGMERQWLVIAYMLTIILQFVVLRFAAWRRQDAA